jgi:mxaA protein
MPCPLPRTRNALLACLLCAGLAGAAAQEPRELGNTLARHYGYLIGERFVQHVQIAAPASYSLDHASLPKAGHANRLLELRALDLSERTAGGERRYDMLLHYQVMATDETLGLTALPRPWLQFKSGTHAGGESRTAVRVGEQHISVSPLSDTGAWSRDGLEAIRPELGTPLMNTLATKQRLAGYALALAGLALYWLYRIYGVPFLARSRGPFYRAWRALRAQRGTETDAVQSGLRRLHRAFDETFGTSVFRHQVDAFLRRHPRYADLREPIERFFDFSRRQFYAAHAASEEQLAELRDLARRLSLVERRLQ